MELYRFLHIDQNILLFLLQIYINKKKPAKKFAGFNLHSNEENISKPLLKTEKSLFNVMKTTISTKEWQAKVLDLIQRLDRIP